MAKEVIDRLCEALALDRVPNPTENGDALRLAREALCAARPALLRPQRVSGPLDAQLACEEVLKLVPADMRTWFKPYALDPARFELGRQCLNLAYSIHALEPDSLVAQLLVAGAALIYDRIPDTDSTTGVAWELRWALDAFSRCFARRKAAALPGVSPSTPLAQALDALASIEERYYVPELRTDGEAVARLRQALETSIRSEPKRRARGASVRTERVEMLYHISQDEPETWALPDAPLAKKLGLPRSSLRDILRRPQHDGLAAAIEARREVLLMRSASRRLRPAAGDMLASPAPSRDGKARRAGLRSAYWHEARSRIPD